MDGYPDLATGVDGAVTMNPFARSFSGTQPISRADPGTLQVMAWGDMDGDGVPDAFVSGPRLMGTFRTRGNRVTPFFDRVTNHLEGIAVQGHPGRILTATGRWTSCTPGWPPMKAAGWLSPSTTVRER